MVRFKQYYQLDNQLPDSLRQEPRQSQEEQDETIVEIDALDSDTRFKQELEAYLKFVFE